MIRVLTLTSAVLLVSFFLFFDSDDDLLKLNVEEFKRLPLAEQAEYLDKAGKNLSVVELRDFIKEVYPDEPNGQHELSHKLGELAIKKEGIAGFGLCDSLLQFGCFHGAALAAVRIKGNDPDLARELW